MIEVRRYATKVDADIGKSYLESYGIPCHVEIDGLGRNYFLIDTKFGCKLMILNPSDEEKSLELLKGHHGDILKQTKKVNHPRYAYISFVLGLTFVPPLLFFSVFSCFKALEQKKVQKKKIMTLLIGNFIAIGAWYYSIKQLY